MHWRRKWQPTPVFLPGESQGRGSLVGCCQWGRSKSDTTEQLHFDFSLSCTGEGNGNPLQCSCLENPRDGGAWWSAVYGVAQSRTRLKQLSSSSSRGRFHIERSLEIIFGRSVGFVDLDMKCHRPFGHIRPKWRQQVILEILECSKPN